MGAGSAKGHLELENIYHRGTSRNKEQLPVHRWDRQEMKPVHSSVLEVLLEPTQLSGALGWRAVQGAAGRGTGHLHAGIHLVLL